MGISGIRSEWNRVNRERSEGNVSEGLVKRRVSPHPSTEIRAAREGSVLRVLLVVLTEGVGGVGGVGVAGVGAEITDVDVGVD